MVCSIEAYFDESDHIYSVDSSLHLLVMLSVERIICRKHCIATPNHIFGDIQTFMYAELWCDRCFSYPYT